MLLKTLIIIWLSYYHKFFSNSIYKTKNNTLSKYIDRKGFSNSIYKKKNNTLSKYIVGKGSVRSFFF